MATAEYNRQYYTSHRKAILERKERYYSRRPMEHTIQNVKSRLAAYGVLGGICVICGEDDPAVLQFDHINNDGYTHTREIGGKGRNLIAWIRHNPVEAQSKVQLLCGSCHARKHSLFNKLDGYMEAL